MGERWVGLDENRKKERECETLKAFQPICRNERQHGRIQLRPKVAFTVWQTEEKIIFDTKRAELIARFEAQGRIFFLEP